MPPLLGGAGSPSTQCRLAEAYRHTKWHLNQSSRLAATDMGRKLGGCALGCHLTQCGRGRGLPACQVSSWSVQAFGHNTPTSQTGRTDSIGWTVLQTVAQKPTASRSVRLLSKQHIFLRAIRSDNRKSNNRLKWILRYSTCSNVGSYKLQFYDCQLRSPPRFCWCVTMESTAVKYENL